jgi:hypothetical protein
MNPIAEIQKRRDDARAAYHEIASTATADELREASMVVEDAQRELSDFIVKGARPCPRCGVMPHGMEQPNTRGGVEYEVGCLGCPAFEHDDGTIREHRVRGGMMPSHAVDAWNAGADYWSKQNLNRPVGVVRKAVAKETE